MIKFGEFTSCCKGQNFWKFYTKYGWKTSSRPFRVYKESKTTPIGKLNIWKKNWEIFENVMICISETIKIMSKSAGRLPQLTLYGGSVKNKKRPGTSFKATHFVEFLIKVFLL